MKHFLFLFTFLFTSLFLAQATDKTPKPKWAVKTPFEQKNFIENVGQFDLSKDFPESKILYSVYTEGIHYYFTNTSIILEKTVQVKVSKREIEKYIKAQGIVGEMEKEEQEEKLRYRSEKQFEQINFENATSNVEVIAGEKVPNYYTYGNPAVKSGETGFKASAYKTLTYKNIYPNIDLVYEFLSDKTGFKYSFVVHPGGDVKNIKLGFSNKSVLKLDADGDLSTKSTTGLVIHHAPESFIKETHKIISSSYKIENNTVKFNTENYNTNETLVIDPWVQVPSLPTSNLAYDVDYDASGNVYVYGGEYPFTLIKYTPAGAVIWTHVTSAFTNTTAYYGDFAVDNTGGGSIYIVEGFNFNGADAIKLNAAGTQTAFYTGQPSFAEMWRIAFSRCTHSAVIAGGGVSNPTYQTCFLDSNLTNLSPVQYVNTTNCCHDVDCLALDDYGSCYQITNERAGDPLFDNQLVKLPLPALLPVTYNVSSGFAWKEAYTNVYIQPTSGIGYPNGYNGITTSNTNVYTYDGYALRKWNGATGAQLIYKRINFPANGDSTVVHWGGISADNCDHVFIGNQSQIDQYDGNLNLVTSLNMQNTVYDVMLGKNGNLYSCGNGFVASNQIVLPPCTNLHVDTAVTNASCTNPIGSATVTVTGGTPAYTITWNTAPVQTGSVITNLAAGTYTATITDNSCPPLTSTVSISINQSNGVTATPTVTNVSCHGGTNGAISIQATGTVVPTYTWSTGATTSSISNLAAGVYTVSIGGGNCTTTLSLNVTQPPVLSYTVSPGTLKCFGDTTSISVAISGGTPATIAPTYTVAWNPPNAQGFSVHGLGVGNYAGFAIDSLNCMVSFSSSLSQPPPIIPNFTYTPACFGSAMQFTDQSTGGPFIGWLWNFGDGSSFATDQNPSHTYSVTNTYNVALTVTTAGNCTATVTNTLTVFPSPTAVFRGDTVAGCPVHKVNFKDSSYTSSGQIVSWYWNFGNGNTSIGQFPLSAISYNNLSPTVSANYSVSLTVVSSNGCSSIVVKHNYITVYPHPQPGFTYASDDGSVIDVLNNTVHFYDDALGASAVSYYLGDVFANPLSINYTSNPNPIHQYLNPDPYIYSVTQWVKNQYGCKDSITEPLPIKPTFTFFIPNSFSPNADGVNEYFKGTGIGIDNTTYDMIIFDRWGNKIFEANDMEKPWDGRFKGTGDVVLEDVYVWKVSFKDVTGEKHEYRGVVSVVK